MANNQTPEKQSAFKELVLPVIVLVAICLVCSALLAVLNDITAPIIVENTRAETLASYLSVLPEGTTEADMTEHADLATPGVEGAVTTAGGAAAVKAAAAGYSGNDVTVYVAFDANGAISALSVDASTQTTGIGSKVAEESFTAGFLGWSGGPVASGAPVDTIASATYSSEAVFAAVNAAIDCYTNELQGGV